MERRLTKESIGQEKKLGYRSLLMFNNVCLLANNLHHSHFVNPLTQKFFYGGEPVKFYPGAFNCF